jgi:hypothetical protein
VRELKKLPYDNLKVAVMGSRDQYCLDNATHVKGSALNELCGAKRRVSKKVEYERDEDYKMDDQESDEEVEEQGEKKNSI